MVSKEFGAAAIILSVMFGGVAVTDNPVKDIMLDFAGDLIGISGDTIDSFIKFMYYTFDIVQYLFNILLGVLLDVMNMFGTSWIIIVGIIFVIFGIIIFCTKNLYTFFLLYEFFILALCIQEKRSPVHKLTLFFEYQFSIVYILIFIISFLFKIPKLLKEIWELLIEVIKFIWLVLSDLAKIVADLVPFT